jgi:hypothetical protein
MAETPTINHGLDEWADQIAALGGQPDRSLSELPARLRGDKAKTIAMLSKLKLPRFISQECSTAHFLAEPDVAFRGLKTAIFYASINARGIPLYHGDVYSGLIRQALRHSCTTPSTPKVLHTTVWY